MLSGFHLLHLKNILGYFLCQSAQFVWHTYPKIAQYKGGYTDVDVRRFVGRHRITVTT